VKRISSWVVLLIITDDFATAIDHQKTLDEYLPLRVSQLTFWMKTDNLPVFCAAAGRIRAPCAAPLSAKIALP
jgi:hypothetical protein